MGKKHDGVHGQKEGEKKKGGDMASEEEGRGCSLVMKMDLHCEGCARRVKRFIKKSSGVDAVKLDFEGNKIMVTGEIDALKLKEGLEFKTKKKVEIIFPNPLPKKVEGENKKGDQKPQKKPEEMKKKQEPPIKVVGLKIRLHCDSCIHKIERIIAKMKGVESVDVEATKDLVTVKGNMNIKTLPDQLKEKLRRSVEIVTLNEEPAGDGGGDTTEGGRGKPKEGAGVKKDGGNGEKKKTGEGEKKTEGNGGVGGNDQKKDADSKGDEKKPTVVTEAVRVEANTMAYYGHGYVIEYMHAPQIFSDDNPNACSVM